MGFNGVRFDLLQRGDVGIICGFSNCVLAILFYWDANLEMEGIRYFDQRIVDCSGSGQPDGNGCDGGGAWQPIAIKFITPGREHLDYPATFFSIFTGLYPGFTARSARANDNFLPDRCFADVSPILR